MRFALICFLLFPALQIEARAETLSTAGNNLKILGRHRAPVGSTFYLHLGAALKGQDPHALNEELQARFTNALDTLKRKIAFSWTMQAEGEGLFFFNLILEPSTQNDLDALKKYLAKAESIDFHGLNVHFDRVANISEVATLEAGNYNENLDDPFVQNFSLPRNFVFNNLAEWTSFTNQYGFALLNRDSAIFLKYLAGFVNDDSVYSHLLDEVLSKNNMTAIAPEVSLSLEGGELTGPDLRVSPFLPYKFFRNCYAEKYENGVCYQKGSQEAK